jgi:chromosome segregation ATPase
MALEAFDEMKKRYDFIIAQRKDLEEAKNFYWKPSRK